MDLKCGIVVILAFVYFRDLSQMETLQRMDTTASLLLQHTLPRIAMVILF